MNRDEWLVFEVFMSESITLFFAGYGLAAFFLEKQRKG